MRYSPYQLLSIALLTTATTALQLPYLQPFLSALPLSLQDYIPQSQNNETAQEQQQIDLVKRQYSNTCPTGFDNCANMGAPQLCCMTDAVCSPDAAGHVACCPTGAACTGTISGVITGGTLDSSGQVVGAGGAATTAPVTATTSFQFAGTATTTTSDGLVPATVQSTAGNGASTGVGVFVGSSTVATPGAARRQAQVPMIARAVVHLVQYLPL